MGRDARQTLGKQVVSTLLMALVVSFASCQNANGTGGAGASASWTVEQLGSAQSNCSNTASKVNSAVSSRDAILICGCVIEEASKKWPYDDFVKNEFAYTEAMSKDGTFERCRQRASAAAGGGTSTSESSTSTSESNTSTSGSTSGGASPDTTLPVIILSGYPTGTNRNSDLNITVSGATSYRYKVGPASTTDCSASVDYSAERLVSVPITDSVLAQQDGLLRVCAIGKNSLGWQTFVNSTGFSWTKDFTSPSAPTSVSVTSTGPTSQIVSWSGPNLANGDYYIVVKKQTTPSSWALSSGVTYNMSQTDGFGSSIIYIGTGTSFTDLNLVTDNLYHYSVFTSDSLKNISAARTGSGMPVRSWTQSSLVGEQGVLPFETSGYQELPKAAADDNGNVIVAWLRSNSSRHVVANVFSNATGWGSPLTLESDSQNSYVPRVVMNTVGQGAVLWAQNNTVKARRYSAGWGPTETVGTYSITSYELESAIDSSGNIVTIFPSGNSMVASRYRPGVGWSGNEILKNHSETPTGGLATADGLGGFMAIWMSGGQPYFSRYSQSWTAGAMIPISAMNLKSVKCDAAGNCLVIYIKWDGHVESIASAKISAQNGWTDHGLLESDITYPVFASISPLAVNADGSATAVWMQKYNCCNYGMFSARYTSATGWSTRSMIESVNHDTGVAPFVHGYGAGNAIAAWQGGSTNNTYDTGRSARYISGQGWTDVTAMGESDFAKPYFIADGLGNGIFFFIRVNVFDFKATRYFP